MATRYQALIRDAAAYEAFRRLVPDLPATYDAWLNQQAEERKRAAAAKNVVRQIAVAPEDFERYCIASGLECNRVSLDAFTVAVASSQS